MPISPFETHAFFLTTQKVTSRFFTFISRQKKNKMCTSDELNLELILQSECDIDAFKKLLTLLTQDHSHAAVRKGEVICDDDDARVMRLDSFDVVSVCLVCLEVKPVAYVDRGSVPPGLIQSFPNVTIIVLSDRDCLVHNSMGTIKASILTELLKYRRRETRKYHQVMGYCLGYDKCDVDWFSRTDLMSSVCELEI